MHPERLYKYQDLGHTLRDQTLGVMAWGVGLEHCGF